MGKKHFLIIISTIIGAILIIGIVSYFYPTPLQVSQVRTNTSHQVSAAELSMAKDLFQSNQIDMGTLAVAEVTRDDYGKTHIWSRQFYKGLPIFWGNIGYHFGGAAGISISGERIGDLNLPTTPKISKYAALKTVRKKMHPYYLFRAELGFRDLNAGTSYTEPDYVLVWRIIPKNAELYPYADIDANSGKLIMFDDGIRY